MATPAGTSASTAIDDVPNTKLESLIHGRTSTTVSTTDRTGKDVSTGYGSADYEIVSQLRQDPLMAPLFALGMMADASGDDQHTAGLPRASILVPLFQRRNVTAPNNRSKRQKGDGLATTPDQQQHRDDGNDVEWHFLFTQRPMHLKSHPGHVCFPGGRQEERDRGDDVVTALRETQEEVGIDPSYITTLCRLSPMRSVNGLCVTPIVGVVDAAHADPSCLDLCKTEVEAAFCVPVSYFWDFNNNCAAQQPVEWHGQTFLMRTYLFEDTRQARTFKIWGLTAHVAHHVAHVMLGSSPPPPTSTTTPSSISTRSRDNQQQQHCKKEGRLHRWMDQSTGGKPYWASRYFVLGSDSTTSTTAVVLHQYDTSRQATSKACSATKKNRLLLDGIHGQIQVTIMDDTRDHQQQDKFPFVIRTLGGRIDWKLAASSALEREEWMRVLMDAAGLIAGDVRRSA